MGFSTSGEASNLHALVFVGQTHSFENGEGTFSPTTSTLIAGKVDAVLVDAQHIRSDVQALGDMIEQTGKRLTTIYVTHGHADHWYGAGDLIRRFPTARTVATAGVVNYINTTRTTAAQQWQNMFGPRVVVADATPETIEGSIDLEGIELRVIELGQGDIAPSTALYAPSIGLVVPGDVVYNQIHAMLGLTGPAEWELWLANIDKIEKLAPRMLVAGHKRPESPDTDVARMLDETRAYIRTFADAAGKAADPDELVNAVSSKYPHFGNIWTLQFSARSYFVRRNA